MWLKEKIKELLNDPQVSMFLLIAAFIILLFYYLGEYLVPVFTSIILAYVLEGLIKPLERLKFPRSICVVLVFLVFMTSVVFLMLWIIPLAIKQFTQFLQDLPSMILTWKIHLQQLVEKYPGIISKLQIDALIGIIMIR
jgi:putative permease